MQLPNADLARIKPEKIQGYLLSSNHPVGSDKANFFSKFGFSAGQWGQFEDALKEHVLLHDVVRTRDTPFGTRYTVEGVLRCPDGRYPMVRSVWFIDTGADIPRLITAYPIRGVVS